MQRCAVSLREVLKMSRGGIVVLCLWTAVFLAGCHKTASAGYETGSERLAPTADETIAADGAIAGNEAPAGAETPASAGGEAEYTVLFDELVRLKTAPLTGEYGFYNWSEEMKDVLREYLNLGTILGIVPDTDLESRGGVSLTVTPWEQGSLDSVDGMAGEGRYRLVSAVITRSDGQRSDRAYYLEKENSAVWDCSLLQIAYDSLALRWVPEAADGHGQLYLMTAEEAEAGKKTEINLFKLDGAVRGQVMCDVLCTRQLAGQREGEALVRSGQEGFTVTGTVLKGGVQEDCELDIKLGLEPGGDGFSVSRSPKRYEAEIPQTSGYALVLGLSGEEDIRTLWVTAGSGNGVPGSGAAEAGDELPGSGAAGAGDELPGSEAAGAGTIVCRELPDVVLRWTGDGMKTVRYLNYRSGVVKHRDSNDEYGNTLESFDWKFLTGRDLPPDRESVIRYSQEHYQWFGSKDGYLSVRERLELVGEDYISATADDSYWGGGSGTWSAVHAFLSPIEILLQENAHLSINDLKGMKNSAKNKISQETTHYTQVYEPRVQNNAGWTTVSQTPLTDSV